MAIQKNADGLLHRSLKTSLFAGLFAGLFAFYYAGPAVAGKYLVFLFWMLINLVIWSYSVREFFGPKRLLVLAPLFALKLVWLATLFVLAYFVNIRGTASFLAFLLGLNTPFLVMSLKFLGSAVIRRSETRIS